MRAKDGYVQVGVLQVETSQVVTHTQGVGDGEEPVFEVSVLVVENDALAPRQFLFVPDEFETSFDRFVVDDRFFVQVKDPVVLCEFHGLAVPFQGSCLVFGVGGGEGFGAGVAVDVLKEVGFVGKDVDADSGVEAFEMLVCIPGAVYSLTSRHISILTELRVTFSSLANRSSPRGCHP